jgi:5-enolpyruvylshikimate-3-phosphate synthase
LFEWAPRGTIRGAGGWLTLGVVLVQVGLSGAVSSQYLTALLMAAPLAAGDTRIEIVDQLVSVPYVDMTLKLMKR